MPSFNISIPLLYFLCLLSLLTTKISSQPLGDYCPSTTTYSTTLNSTYHANLNFLLSSLSSNATKPDTGFNNLMAGLSPNAVYGLFLCRGDVTADQCHDCVRNASQEILQRCPNRTVAIIWYDLCLLRYSNRNIFSIVDNSTQITMPNGPNVTNEPAKFMWDLQSAMSELATRAASGESGWKFATSQPFIASQIIYSLMQCTPDLPTDDCNTCLQNCMRGIPSCCDKKQGARVIFPSCNLRYENYSFFNVTASTLPMPTPPVPPPPPPPVSTPPVISPPPPPVSTGMNFTSHIP